MVLMVAILEDGIVGNVAAWDGERPWVLPPGTLGMAWQDGMILGAPWPVPDDWSQPEPEP